MRKYILCGCISSILLLLCSSVAVYATEREDVLQMDIVTREEWGANEVRRRASSFGIPTDPSPVSERTLAIYHYLLEYFPDEQAIDSVESYEDGHELHRPRSYKTDKTAIIVHHTASDPARITEQGGVIPHLQQIYKYHTFTRGWGDIGYHFLIDQDGTIYEGRAGGSDVIAAHAKRNNSTAIGISLIGNFQNEYPSRAMIDSLTELTTALALHYDINPQDMIDAHREASTAPYVEDVHTHALLGHRDAGHTSCPGDHVYALLPSLREQVTRKIFSDSLESGIDAVLVDLPMTWLDGTLGSTEGLVIEGQDTEMISGDVSCSRVEEDGSIIPLSIGSCRIDDTTLHAEVTITGEYRAGGYPLLVQQGDLSEIWYIRTVWGSTLEMLHKQRRKPFLRQLPSSPRPSEKITDHITIDRARDMTHEDIRVFLHDVSVEGLKGDTISCEHSCRVIIHESSSSVGDEGKDDRILEQVDSMIVRSHDQSVGVALGTELEFFGTSVEISDENDGWVSIDSYERKSYAGVPRNRFQGILSVENDEYLHIPSGQWHKGFIYINTLNFRDYLYGLGEAAVNDPLEKQHVLALLTKAYAIYYLSEANEHPSMDVSGHAVGYDAIDDPRAFQKYVGAGWLDVYPDWKDIVDDMRDTRVLYDDYVPILPYFNCSPGTTRSAQEKRGWSDTPWLDSVIDFEIVGCEDFAGHGVGLSGKGATYMAQHGIGFADILGYYYHGISVVD